jgi:NAD(P)-dependent dehydrogenase (short-subunit alcohol dehydrogenase family)
VPETALVTGASSGIGAEFARQLAQRGHDLVLVARRADRLEALAAELPTEARVLTCDLASDAASLATRVAELGVDVDLLVNNAGFGTSGPFIEHDPERDAEQVRLNCEAVVTLTHSFLPGMVERRRGGIINVASSAGMQPIPYETEWQQVAGYESGRVGVVPGRIPAEQVVREALAAYDRGRRSVIPGRAIRWFIRVTRPSPRAVQLRVTERLYRPKD